MVCNTNPETRLFSAFASENAKRDCGPRRSPGLAALRASVLPALEIKTKLSAVAGLRFLALQSRGGDGSRLRITSRRTLRLPVHEVRDDCDGAAAPAMGYMEPRKIPAALNHQDRFQGLRACTYRPRGRKSRTCKPRVKTMQAKWSPGADHSIPSPH